MQLIYDYQQQDSEGEGEGEEAPSPESYEVDSLDSSPDKTKNSKKIAAGKVVEKAKAAAAASEKGRKKVKFSICSYHDIFKLMILLQLQSFCMFITM